MNKGMRQLARIVRPYGLRIDHQRRGHARIVDARGRLIQTLACSPSSQHSYESALNDLVRRGIIPPKEKGRTIG